MENDWLWHIVTQSLHKEFLMGFTDSAASWRLGRSPSSHTTNLGKFTGIAGSIGQSGGGVESRIHWSESLWNVNDQPECIKTCIFMYFPQKVSFYTSIFSRVNRWIHLDALATQPSWWSEVSWQPAAAPVALVGLRDRLMPLLIPFHHFQSQPPCAR